MLGQLRRAGPRSLLFHMLACEAAAAVQLLAQTPLHKPAYTHPVGLWSLLRHTVHPVAGPGSLPLLLHNKTHTHTTGLSQPLNPKVSWVVALDPLPLQKTNSTLVLLPVTHTHPRFLTASPTPQLAQLDVCWQSSTATGTLMHSSCWCHRPLHTDTHTQRTQNLLPQKIGRNGV